MAWKSLEILPQLRRRGIKLNKPAPEDANKYHIDFLDRLQSIGSKLLDIFFHNVTEL